MSRRRNSPPPRDHDGEPLIDTGVLMAVLGMTAAGARRWAARVGAAPVRRGAHGAGLYRLADVEDALIEHQRRRII